MTRLHALFPTLAGLALHAAPAGATLYTGNPDLGFRVDRPQGDYTDGEVVLDKVRVHHCGGGSTDYDIDETVDPVEGYSLTISGGDHCGVTWFWDSDLDIDGSGSYGTFTVRFSEASTGVTLDTEIDPVALTPYEVVSGTMSGGGPWLLTWIE
jgi:hypothetical protein